MPERVVATQKIPLPTKIGKERGDKDLFRSTYWDHAYLKAECSGVGRDNLPRVGETSGLIRPFKALKRLGLWLDDRVLVVSEGRAM